MAWIKKPKKSSDRSRELKRKERMSIYNTQRWRNLREIKLTVDPICEECDKVGKVTPADDVHHIVSFMSTDNPVTRKHLAFDYNNLMSLCKQCHSDKHS